MVHRRFVNTPYSVRETVGFLLRSFLGSSRRHAREMPAPPEKLVVAPAVPAAWSVCLFGDLLPTRGARLRFDDEIAAFVADADLLVANLEGPIAFRRYRRPHPLLRLDPRSVFVLGHDERILDDLARLAPPSRWLLGLANNHAADFGERAFDFTRGALAAAGFRSFGSADAMEMRLADLPVELCGASRWANVRNDLVAAWTPGRSLPQRRDTRAFRFLYLHWGYEFEHYPRPDLRRQARALLDGGFDALVGHHPHVVQPLALLPDGRLVAYSLGNVNWARRIRREARVGSILRCTLGSGSDGRWLLRDYERRWTRLVPRRREGEQWVTACAAAP